MADIQNLVFEGKNFLSSSECARKFGYTRHYIARLCRRSEVSCRMHEGNWYVEEASLISFREKAENKKKEHYAELSRSLKKNHIPPSSVNKQVTDKKEPEIITSVPVQSVPLKPTDSVTTLPSKNIILPRPVNPARSAVRPRPSLKYTSDDRPLIPLIRETRVFIEEKPFQVVRVVKKKNSLKNKSTLRDVLHEALGSRLPEKVLALSIAITFATGAASLFGSGDKIFLSRVETGPGISIPRSFSAALTIFSNLLSSHISYKNPSSQAAAVSLSLDSDDLAQGPASDVVGSRYATSTGSSNTSSSYSPPTGIVLPQEKIIHTIETREIIREVGISAEDLQAVKNELLSRINYLSAQSSGSYNAPSGVYTVASQTNRIDVLTNTSITNPSISGGSWSNASVAGSFSGDFSGTGSNVSLTGTTTLGVGTTTASNGLNITSGCFSVSGTCIPSVGFGETWGISGGYLTPTTTLTVLLNGGFVSSASSTITGNFNITGNSTTTNATTTGALSVGSTLSVSGLATLTNLLATASSTLQNFTAVNSTSTSATSTNFFSTTASSTNLFASNLSIGSLSGFLKATNGSVAAAAINLSSGSTDITGTLSVGSGGTGVTSFGGTNRILYTSSTDTLASSGSLTFDGTILSTTQFLATASSTLQNLTFTNATGTNATTTNFFSTTASSTNLFSSNLTIGGDALFVGSPRNVGVGTTSPYARLSIKNTFSGAQVSIAYDDTRYTELQTDSTGDFILNPSGDDTFLNADNL
ncbi:MAG: hypothetical protein AAB597_00260, partial [Patescibacteria group bacterium]